MEKSENVIFKMLFFTYIFEEIHKNNLISIFLIIFFSRDFVILIYNESKISICRVPKFKKYKSTSELFAEKKIPSNQNVREK